MLKKLTAITLAMIMSIGNFNMPIRYFHVAKAQEITKQITTEQSIKIEDFKALDEKITHRTVPIGTAFEALNFTKTLEATTSDGAISISVADWKIDPALNEGVSEYNSKAGSYVFTPILSDGYELSEGVKLPEIYVLIGELKPAMLNVQTAGDFTIDGGTAGTDYSFAGDVLTIQTDTPMTIANTNPSTATNNRIVVPNNVTANITLAGVNIDGLGNDQCAFELQGNATVNLTLADGSENTLNSGFLRAGLQVPNGTTLTIDGETNGTGKLTATGGERGAGIGGRHQVLAGTITIAGGTVTATSGNWGAGIGGGADASGGTITITGGTVIANGTSGAGIGSGYNGKGDTTIITITGGTVTANGGSHSAGIGNGYGGKSGTITINGGTVTANGGINAAGIGNGYDGTGGTTTITGGTVTANGGSNGAGIGGGYAGSGGTTTITGGTVTANGDSNGAGIGNGNWGSDGTFSTGDSGKAFIMANSISDKSKQANWRGVIFEGNNGEVYKDPTLTTNAEIPAGKILNIAAERTLTMNNGITFTNKGTINCYGILTPRANVTNEGAGVINDNSAMNVTFKDAEGKAITTAYPGDTITIVATATKNISNNLRVADTNKVEFTCGSWSQTADVTVDGETATATCNVTLTGNNWNAGVRTITAKFGGTSGFFVSEVSADLTINKTSLTKPTVTSTYVYNGTEQTLELKDFDNNTMTIANDKSTNAGTYTATISLKDAANYEWADGSTTDLKLSWTIAKAARTISVSKNTVASTKVELNESKPSIGDGTVEYGKNSTNVEPKTWQTSTTFDNLVQGTTYYFFAKVTGDSNYNDATSNGLAVTTMKRPDEGGGSGASTSYLQTMPTEITITIKYISPEGKFINAQIIKGKHGTKLVASDLKVTTGYELKTNTFEHTITEDATINVQLQTKFSNTTTLLDIKVPDTIKARRYIQGYPNGTFKPDNTITRAEAVSMLYKLTYNGTRIDTNILEKYSDVDDTKWFAIDVAYLTQKGILNTENGRFRPNDNITRAEMAQLLFNSLLSYAYDITSFSYGDVKFNLSDIGSSAMQEEIKQLASNGMLNGYENGTFKPNGSITRAEAVSMIAKVFGISIGDVASSPFTDVSKTHWAFKFIAAIASK